MSSPDSTALRGLLLILVEVQNLVRAQGNDINEAYAATQLRDLVESEHAHECINLARAALDTEAAPAAIPADQAGVHA